MKALFGALLISTLLWGTAVVAHQHIDVDHELCSVCLLPTIGTAATTPLQLNLILPEQSFLQDLQVNHLAALILAYQGRAPPR